jgi:hypothetical protein
MDDLVRAAMAKWPHVPACVGWLGLDARGRWWMRDDRAQAAGPFAGPHASADSRGSCLRHEKLVAFIERNYACDEAGQWYFQNGPQRVYVELESAPWVLRLSWPGQGGLEVRTHTGRLVAAGDCLVDEAGRAYLVTDLGLGVVHTQDMHVLADALEAGVCKQRPCEVRQLEARYGFVASPQRQAEKKNGSIA